jgi:5-methylcytosine-specific restriction protein A
MHNPEWTRDELILGLDLYFTLSTTQITRDNSAIVALSTLLNALPIHRAESRDDRFRNPDGVSMELRGFLRFDPRYAGDGLRGAKLAEVIWSEFATAQSRLRATAAAIQAAYAALSVAAPDSTGSHEDDADIFPEGLILTRLHRLRERNRNIVRRKKERALAEFGKLECEVCEFDFVKAYGQLGDGFAECHHVLPLCELVARTTTRLTDLAIVCANCHRMLHRSPKWLTIDALRTIIAEQRGTVAMAFQEGK